MRKIRILVVDDHPMIRVGLRMLIDAQTDMKVVGEAADAGEAISRAREMDPDVVLMDLSIPGTDELDPIRQTRLECPRVRVLVLTMHDDPAYARSALGAGASGYVIKTAEGSELLSAIRAVREGRTFVNVHLGGSTASVKRKPASIARAGPSVKPALSPREQEVFGLLVRGHTNREIGKRIGVSVKTVETYRARLSEKLGLRGRADFMRYAIEAGLIVRGKRSSDDL